MAESQPKPAEASIEDLKPALTKLSLELGPLVVFFLVNAQGENILEAMIVGLGQMNIRNVGPATRSLLPNAATAGSIVLSGHGDGLVSARQGVTTYLYGSSPDWLYVAYGGTTSGKKKSILAMDYTTKAWHSVYYDDGTTFNDDGDGRIWGMILSAEDDGVQRLHWWQEGASLAPGSNSVAFYIEEPEKSEN